jgi:beta-lactam-binding protein with PASTA domain
MTKEKSTNKIAVSIIITVLAIALATVTTFLIINLNTNNNTDQPNSNQEEQEASKKQEDNKESTPKVSSNTDPKDLEKPDVNGLSIEKACEALRNAGWRIYKIYDKDYSENYSCADEGTAISVYFYSNENNAELHIK